MPEEKRSIPLSRLLNKSLKGLGVALKWTALGGIALAGSYLAGGAMAEWYYQIPTGYGRILTQRDGKRVPITEEGWKFRLPLVTSLSNTFPLMNQPIYYEGKEEAHEVIAKGDYVLNASAVMFYRITNLDQFAIRNLDGGLEGRQVTPRKMLGNKLDAIVRDYIQRTHPQDLIHDREVVSKNIKTALHESDVEETFGIEITSFRLLRTSYIQKVIEANAEKQKLKAEAEGRLDAAKKEKETLQTLAEARADYYEKLAEKIQPKTPEEKMAVLNLVEALRKYSALERNPTDKIWVIDGGTGMRPIFQPEGGSKSVQPPGDLDRVLRELERLRQSLRPQPRGK